MGLFLAQWQGFTHGVHHVPELQQAHDSQAEINEAHHTSSHDSRSSHHCAAYDSLTLSFAFVVQLPVLRVIDANHEVIKQYQFYQASIDAGAPFEARAPPAIHV